ncbi:MAG: trpF [Gammaproteobacteria bacterium]|nr:trpF [Gammaproteobacteria bacterium]
MTKAKICGITNLDDALCAAKNGAWAIGFNFYRASPRYISPQAAKKIISDLPSHILKVGIFIDEPANVIINTLNITGLDFAQVYEDLQVPESDKKRMILVIQASSEQDLPPQSIMQAYAYILVDAPKSSDGLLGGTGRLANWPLAHELAQNYQLILAGGLNPTNVSKAIHSVRPFAVDVASGVEKSPGIKDQVLVREFIASTIKEND